MRLGWSRAGGPGAGLEAASKVDKLEAASEVETGLEQRTQAGEQGRCVRGF